MRRAYRHDDRCVCHGGDYSPTQYPFAYTPQEGDGEYDDEDAGKDSGKGGYFVHRARRPLVQRERIVATLG
jgi:hypothetical protein